MRRSAGIMVTGIGSLLVVLFLSLGNIYLGELNQDEGWYLYAASQVADQKMVYRDFAFTQAPMLPLVYGLFYGIVERFGLAGGRTLSCFIGILASVFCAGIVIRKAPSGLTLPAGIAAFTLAGINVYHSYFTSIVKTYSLCALFLITGLWCISAIDRRRGKAWAVMGGLLLAAAAGTRLSSGMAMPVVGVYLLWVAWKNKNHAWLFYGLGGMAGLLIIFLPFVIFAYEGFSYGVFEYHSARWVGGTLKAAYTASPDSISAINCSRLRT